MPRSCGLCFAAGTQRDLRSIVKVHVIVALLVLVAFSFGCGQSEKANKAIERVTINNVGDNSVGLPADFPKDVPILKGATLKVAMSQGERMVVHLYTTASIADAAKYYNAELKDRGWNIENTSHSGEMFIVSAKKGKTLCGVTVSKEGKGTLVRLVVSQAGS